MAFAKQEPAEVIDLQPQLHPEWRLEPVHTAAGIGGVAVNAEFEGSSLQRRPRRPNRPTAQVNDEDEDLVRLYLDDIGRHNLLDRDGELRLAQEIETGKAAAERLLRPWLYLPFEKSQFEREAAAGAEASQTFINSNLRLVVSIAKRYQASGMPLLDLIQEGNLGLIHAVEKFDGSKGFKFSTYATWWIRQAVARGIAKTGRTIRLPVKVGENYNALRKTEDRLLITLGRKPTSEELACALNMPIKKVQGLMAIKPDPISFSDPLTTGSETEFGEVIADASADSPPDAAINAMASEELDKFLDILDKRERMVIKLRYGLDGAKPRTLEEIGHGFDLTRERIRQIEAKAFSTLRSHKNKTSGRALLDFFQ
jgi:RNA polymerase sigma factor (sigma-70 family)